MGTLENLEKHFFFQKFFENLEKSGKCFEKFELHIMEKSENFLLKLLLILFPF